MSIVSTPLPSGEQILRIARPFLRAIFEPDEVFELRSISYSRGGSQSCFSTLARLDEAITQQWVHAHHSERRGLFVGVATRKPRRVIGAGRASSAVDVLHARALWCDVDGLAEADPGRAVEDVLARVEAASLPSPSIAVHSGRGVHLYFRLTEPCPAAAIPPHLRALASAIGADRSATDCVRVMRLPGTYNSKDPENIREVRIMHRDDDAVYDLGSFPAEEVQSRAARHADNDFDIDADQLADLLSRLSQHRCDDRAEWIRVTLACRYISDVTGDGRVHSIWDAWSRRSAAYSEQGNARVWRTAQPRGDIGVGTIVHLAREDSGVLGRLGPEELHQQCQELNGRRVGMTGTHGEQAFPPEPSVNAPSRDEIIAPDAEQQGDRGIEDFHCDARLAFRAVKCDRDGRGKPVVDFQILIDRQWNGFGVSMRDNMKAATQALTQVSKALEAGGHGKLLGADRSRLQAWLNTRLRRQLERLAREADATAKARAGAAPAVVSLMTHLKKNLDPRFVDAEQGWWSEKLGRFVRRTSDVVTRTDRAALEIVRQSSDHRAGPGEDDCDAAVQPVCARLLKVAAAEIENELPTAAEADLDASSRAARAAANELRQLLASRSTGLTVEKTVGEQVLRFSFKASLCGRALAQVERGEVGDAWCRLVEDEALWLRRTSDQRLWLALRRDFLLRARGPHLREASVSDRAVHAIFRRYGLSDGAEDAPSARVVDGENENSERLQLLVLNRNLVADMLEAALRERQSVREECDDLPPF